MATERSVSSFGRVRVDKQHIERQLFDQILEAVVEKTDIVAFAENTRDFADFDARRDQVDFAVGRNRLRASRRVLIEVRRHIVGGFFDFALAHTGNR